MTTRDGGGASDRIAPVIPLFGATREVPAGDRGAADHPVDSDSGRPDSDRSPEREPVVSHRSGDAGLWRSTWDDSTRRSAAPASSASSSAFVSAGADDEWTGPSDRHPARGGRGGAPRLRVLQGDGDGREGAAATPDVREVAEELLVRKLRTRSLSVSEARLVLRGIEREGTKLDPNVVDDILDAFGRRGYLDDSQLAGQLVAAGIERKGQGRVALSRALAQRGIPRELIDAALDELPDDDAERALEYARSKARSLSRLDGDTALRRLVGQLARRGYNGGIAMTAAKAALAEATFGRPSSGVRFVDSD